MEFLNGVPVCVLLCLGNVDVDLGEIAWDVWVCTDGDTGYDAECAAATAAESPKEIYVMDVICDDMIALNTVSGRCFDVMKV